MAELESTFRLMSLYTHPQLLGAVSAMTKAPFAEYKKAGYV